MLNKIKSIENLVFYAVKIKETKSYLYWSIYFMIDGEMEVLWPREGYEELAKEWGMHIENRDTNMAKYSFQCQAYTNNMHTINERLKNILGDKKFELRSLTGFSPSLFRD